MTPDDFTEAARAVGADPEDVRESMRNATEYASRNGMSDAEFVLWIWHAGAIYGRDHLTAQDPTDAGPHELDESTPIRNLGYYRSSARCKCGHEVIWGEHDGDAGLDEAWRVHLMRSAVHVARAARRDEETR